MRKTSLFFGVVCFSLTVAMEAEAVTVDFDDLTTEPYYEYLSPSVAYAGFLWQTPSYYWHLYAASDNYTEGWLHNTYGSPSGEYALLAYNGFAVTHGGVEFDFNGAFVSAMSINDDYHPTAGARQLTVLGYRHGVLVGSVTVDLNAGRYDWFAANLFGVDKVVFKATGGSSYSGFLLDNFTYNAGTVPEPGTIALFTSGGAFLLPWLRRRRGKRGLHPSRA
ncbi:MAG: PEP-CTERM sorting domain-containing protein [Deltaproteobacteria bacterium]|nr:MAG: PEP-CTERM sorting domain-containing protein [Deltaproteobacteria bacterium]